MSKRGKIMGLIAFVLLFGSLALFLFGKSGRAITIGLYGLGLTAVYIALLGVIASFNKAKLRRRAYEDLHRIAEQNAKKEK